MSTSPSSSQPHPATNRGQTTPDSNAGSYAPKTNSAPGGTATLPPPPPVRTFPDVPLTPGDVEVLRENKGCFEDGYTPEDADRVLSQFESVQMDVFWEYNDDMGLAGDSFFAGVPRGKESLPDYREMHPDAWTYLYDPESEVDPAKIPSLLSREEARINGGELYTFQVRMGQQHAFEDRNANSCENCGDPVYDSADEAMCTACVDLSQDHDSGEHDPSTGGERDDLGPQCKEGVGENGHVDPHACVSCGNDGDLKNAAGETMCERCMNADAAGPVCDEDPRGGEGCDGYPSSA